MGMAGIIAGIAGFLKERDIPFKELTVSIGDKFEGLFSDLEGRGAGEVMEHLLSLEVLPMGAEVISKRIAPDQAEVMLTSLPPRAVLEKFGTTPKELLKGFGINSKTI